MKKFTLIDYIIIILVICAIAFAFIHIATDDSSKIQKTAFDASTLNKIPDTYSDYYKDGLIVNATVEGFNSTNNEPVTVTGTVIWQDNAGGANVVLLIETANGTYSAGLYRYNPNADIYIDHISLETNGETYENLTEITISPENITSLNDLTSKISNDTDYELTTTVSVDSANSTKMQEITNVLLEHSKRTSIAMESDDATDSIILTKATPQDIADADSILGSFNGITGKITVRIYNCTDSQLESIKNNYDVTNIRNF